MIESRQRALKDSNWQILEELVINHYLVLVERAIFRRFNAFAILLSDYF